MVFHIAGTGSSMVLLFNRMGFDKMPFLGIACMAASGVGMNFLLVYSLFKTVSDTYMEAARIDGAGQFRIFGEIMLPHAMGIVGTIWVIGAIGAWNDYATPKIYLEDSEIYTIALGIQKIQSKVLSTNGDAFFRNNFPVFYAAIIVSLVPVIIVFLIFQKKIMALSLGGGIK
jgi:ABC-type glycerol-3-phosphate transport system permease component